nr:hypothetical protein [Tanacetum cinerariifolium]
MFEKYIFKQREEINDRKLEMFELLRELTSSRTPEKVLVREEANNPITKTINAISLIKMEKEKGIKGSKVAKGNVIELNKLEALEPIESPGGEEEMEKGTDGRSVESMKGELARVETKAEIPVETPRSRHIGFYLEHEINKKLIEGLLDNHKYNDSLLAIRLGIAEDVLIDIAGYVYPIDFMILDIKEDRNKPFILGTPFLTMAKAVIRFEKGTITLKYGKNKIDFVKCPALLSELEKIAEDD